METITLKQKEILKFIVCFIKKEQAPTYKEIGIGVGIKAKSAIYVHMNQIESKGFIEREHRSSRAIRITEKGRIYLEEKW
ncbi:LexA family protein [Enterococcus termitis]